LDHSRTDRTGGGTGVLVRDSLQIEKFRASNLVSFEYSEWIIVSGSFRLRLVVMYGPPYAPSHAVTAIVFVT
jgi:hypothetical protein